MEDAKYCHRCGASIRRRATFVRYAGFWRRVIAVFIDLFLMAPAILMLKDLVIVPPSPAEQHAIEQLFVGDRLTDAERQQVGMSLMQRLADLCTLIFFVCGPYYVLTESSALQGTLGKRAVGLRVTDLDGRRIRPGRAIVRYLARFLSALPWQLGFLLAAFTAKKQCLHDIFSKTLVVIAERPRSQLEIAPSLPGPAEDCQSK